MKTELDSLATALYVKTGGLLKDSPQLAPWRPAAGIAPLLSDAELIHRITRTLAVDTTLWTDDVRVVDSTPVECGRSRETVKRSDLAGRAQYGYCASHSRFFWGLRLHLVCTLRGPARHLRLDRGQGREFEQQLAELDIRLLRPTRKGEAERAGSQLFKPLRQVIESINETFKGQLDLERHRGRSCGH